MREFIGAFSTSLEIQFALVAKFYGVIHVMEEAQKMKLTNVWLECDSTLVCATFTARTNVPWMLHNRCDEILVLITVGKSGLGLFIFFVKGMRLLISWPI